MIDLEELKKSLLGDFEHFKKNLVFGRAAGSTSGDVVVTELKTTALTMIGPRLLDDFRMLIERAVADDVPGHIVETGVWRGGACIWAAGVLENLGSDKLVYVCDSFCGLPPATHPKETLDFPESSLAVSLEEVEDNFVRRGLSHRAVFVKGWFRDTMPSLDVPVSVLRLDGDLFESTDDVLKYMYGRVSRGGYVIVDDYQLPSCRRAVDEFRSRQHLRGSLPKRAGVWWQKP